MLNEDATVGPGLEVYTADETDLGAVKRVWRADGSVNPPQEVRDTTTVHVDPASAGEAGYFLVARALAPDWYVPFSAIGSVTSDRLILNVTIEEARRLSWQEPPQ